MTSDNPRTILGNAVDGVVGIQISDVYDVLL